MQRLHARSATFDTSSRAGTEPLAEQLFHPFFRCYAAMSERLLRREPAVKPLGPLDARVTDVEQQDHRCLT